MESNKSFENKEIALNKIKELENLRIEKCNNTIKYLDDIFESFPTIKFKDVKKDIIAFYMAENVISCVKDAVDAYQLEDQINNIKLEIEDGEYDESEK